MLVSIFGRLPRGGGRRSAPAAAAAAAIATLAVAAGPARASSGIVIGDSIGVGVSMASGLPRLARNSVAIRGGSILGQLRQAPPGATVFMSLGTNDAVGRIDGLDGDIRRIVQAVAAAGQQVVWIGPPCVLKSWDTNAQRLDAQLRASTAGTGITYVSMRDPSMCASGARAKDGVHFTMGGYGQMWAKARVTAGFEGGTTAVAQLSPGKSKRRLARHRHRRSRLARTKDGLVPTAAAAPKTRGPASANAAPQQ